MISTQSVGGVMKFKAVKVPTGHICLLTGERTTHGNTTLEFLSLGDYGKDKNVKASFLGLNRDIDGVPHGDLLPLEEKWVVTISSQYGCSMGCRFCDVPKVGPGANATLNDLHNQVKCALSLHPEVKYTKRLNIHYARMGEPTFNFAVLEHATQLPQFVNNRFESVLVHPVVSTMLPRDNARLLDFLLAWCDIKNELYEGNAGLQFSINSTSQVQRDWLFNGASLSLAEIAHLADQLPYPVDRKYALNFALSRASIVVGARLQSYFDPDKFMVKITPMHETSACKENGLDSPEMYYSYVPYKQVEEDLKRVGFDVLVFVPSIEEDQGRITCGNAILSGIDVALAEKTEILEI